MNLFRKQKFSIRKFNIGIFSALIATVAFLAHPGQATASELEPSQNNDTTAQSDGGLENTSQSNPISEETTNTLSGQTVPSSTENKQTQNVPNHNAQPIAINTEEAESAQTASYTNINENNDTSDDGLHVNQPAKHHIEAQSEDVTNHTNSNHSNSSIPENKATTESSSKPKKRGKRSLDTNNGNDTTSTTQNTDPNLSNTGPNGINTVITFDDLGIKTSTNRSRPEVKVVDSLNGFTMVNGGKVGLLNSVLERTSVFDSADPKNYQAIDNVVALGRIKGNDPNDHDGFNGIEKEFSVNPNSEIIFSFNTMTAKNRKGGTQLVLRNAENNQEIASTDIQGGGVYRLFKLPDNVHRLKVQFLPMNEIHSDFKRIQQLHDGYRYYSFIDTIGVNSGSHLYVKSRQVNKNVKNGKEFEVNTRIENNGNFAAAIGQNELTYKVTLPENFEYVDNSTEVSFVNGNVPNSTVNPFSVNFDRQNHTLTFSSNGLNLGRSAQDVARFLPNKILNIRYKLRPVNISTPREVTFNEAIKYKTFSEYYINTNDNTVTGQQTPFSINVIMNKDDLSEQVNKDIIPSNYTLASYNKYNKLKERAQTVLDEETNNTPFNQRYSQTQIDDLLHELQTTLINRVSASREINDKAQEMTDAVYDSTELTTEEKDTLVDQIENHKNEISNNIDDELTDDGVERVKEAGLHTLESDTPHPVTKPNARQVVNNRADQQKTLIRNNHEATTEEQNEAIRQVEAHSSDAIAKIGEAETDTTVNEARDNGTKLIATDVPNPTKKAEARAAVTNSANSKIKDINNNTQATLDERNDAIALVNRSKDEAIQNINTAQGNDDVTEAQNNGTNTIQQVPLTPVKRQNAIATINAKADEQKRLIQANNNATTEEKADAERKVNEAVITANQNITNATTNRDVDQAQTTGSGIISAISPATKIKEDARAAVEAKAIAQNQQINSNNMATTEEKEDALNQVEAHKQAAIATINQAQSTQQVSEAKNNGINTINQDQPNAVKKNNTKIILEQKGNEKKSAIAQTPDATTEEKQEAVSAVSQAVTNGITHINQANSNDDVDQELSNAEQIITQTNVNVQKKPQARQALIAKTNERQSTINTDNEGTIEEKQKAIQSLNDAKNLADEQITQAASNQNVDNALNIGISNISKIQTNFTKKQQARDQVNQKFQEKEAELNSTPHATQDEKQDALTRLTQAKETALNDINQAQTNQNVDTALTSGIQNIQNTQVNVRKKQEAKTTINDIVQQHKQSIQNNDDATTEEKEVANNLVNASQQNVISKIDNATTNNQIDGIVSDGRQSINAITPDTSIKRNAKNDIDIKAADKKIKIQRINDATDEEIQEANRKIEEAKIEAKDNIQRNSTRDQVNEAKTNGINKIENITPATTVKSEARQAVQNKANEQINHIQNTPDATEEEKQEATNRVNAGLAQAIQNINNAHSTQEVNESKTNSIATIKSVQPNVIKKPTAINSLTQEANNQKTLIGNDGNATDDEKEAAKQLVTQKLNEQIQKIHESTQDNQVDNVKAQAITAIKLINANAHKRQDAINILTNLAESKKSDIRANQDATTEEKNTAIQSIDDTLAQARNNINGANTNALVDENLEDGKQKLQRIVLSTQTKTQAKADIAQAIGQQRSTIDQNQNATTEEKQEALERLNQETNGVNDRIQAALANQNVTDEKNNILETIRNVEPIVIVKPKANEIIRKKAAEQTTLINQNQDATLEEKQIALGKLEEVKNEALNQVSQAHSNNDVKIAENNGIAKISEVHPETIIKRNAKQEIEQDAQSQIDTINANNKSTNEEKSAAIDRVNVAKIDAINNITNATTTQLVNDAKNSGNTSISQILPSTAVKTNALAALASEAKNKNAIIDQTPNATAEEKEEANNKVDRLQEEADANILKAHTTDEVNNIKNQAVQNINAVQVEVIKKQNVKNQLNQFIDNQKKIIENTPDATLEEKAEANRLLQNVLTSTSDEIANVDHNNEVDQALDKARPKIEEIVPQVSKKRDVLNAIQEAFNSQTQEIQENQEATNEEKTEALNKINQLLNQAKVNIDQAQSNKDVDSAKTRSIQDIEQIQPHPQTKATGRHRLNEKANQQQSTIATHPNSTIEERQEASAKLQEVLKKAIAKIDKGQTNDDVEKTVVNGIAEIENILPATTVKDKAKADVNAEKEQKNLQINSNDEATTEEKLVASDNLNHVVETTNQAIEDAPDTNQVNVEKNKGIGTIRDIQPLVVKKPTAKSKIESAVEKKKTEINQTQNATHDEVREGLNQLNQIHEKAKNDVNQSQTNQQVENAEQNSLDQINNFRPDFSKKRNAVAEIVKAQQNKIDEIEQEFSATQEEKDNALQHLDEQVKEIINSINQANTDNEVDNAKTSGLNNITEYRPEYNKKKNAILKLYDVSDTQEAIINGYPDATEDELQEANSKLNKILLDAKKQIGLAHTNNEVDDIYNEVSQKMKTILPRVDTKAVARSVLNALAKQLIKTFENTADVTHEERNDAINHVKEQLSLVFNAIEKDRKDIQVAQDELFGLNELNSIFINITQKPTARKAISGMASQLNNSINNTPYATEEERQIALNKVKAIVDDANEKIREANTDSEVLGTKSNAITLLQAISADVQVKPQAFEEINAQAEIQRERINGNSDATREEKEEALKQVDTLVNHSFITINNVNKNQEVYDTKDKTIEAIHKIKPISTIKPQALNEITIQLDTQRDLIKNNKESTVEEKASAIDKLIKTAARIAEAIDKAQTNEEVKNIKKQSIDEISKILPVIEIKSAARNEIHQKAEVIRGLINDNEEATKEEKDIALNQLDTTLTQANVSIDQALTNEAVNRAKEIANSEINKISVIAIKKPEAIAEIQELADKKLNKFKQSQEATIEEKQSAINELEQALKSAINHIHQSQNNESVSAALKESISLIDSIEIQAHKKLEAKAYIDGYSDDKINDISSRATNEEKQIFVSKLKALINRTHKQIDEAETFVSVETIVRNFKVEADKLNSIVRKKAKASKEIELEADHVKQMINANLSASTRVKQNARTLINEIVSNALSQLNKVTTNKEVDEIVNETIEKLKSIQIREDKILSSQRSSTSMTEKSNQCYSSENNTIKSLPEAGNADKSLPLAGVTLISGLAIMSSRKKKKDKKVND